MAQTTTLLTGPDPTFRAVDAAWGQWRARCALAKCDPHPAAVLCRFAGSRTAGILRRLGPAAGLSVPEDRDAWHLFEVHMVTGRTRQGKRFKEWLFARALGQEGAARVDTLQGGATLIIRSVIREWIRREAPVAGWMSLDAPLPGTDGLNLADLVPSGASPADMAAEADIEILARQVAHRHMNTISRRVCVGLCLRALGFPLDGAAAERAAGCSKTTLHSAVRQFINALAADVLARYRSEAPGTGHAIARRAVQIVREKVVARSRQEKWAARFFHTVKGTALAPRRSREMPS